MASGAGGNSRRANTKEKPLALLALSNRNRLTNRSPGLNGRTKPPAQSSPPLQGATLPSYEELLRFFNESIDLLCFASFNGKFTQLNPAWEIALGWTVPELEARPFIDFVHPDDRTATVTEMEKLVGGGNTITFENRYQCKDGSWKWLQWTAAPLPGRREIYAVARDVTLQKEVEKKIHDAMDRERSRIGRDLHDSLGPHLAAIGYAASFLTNELRRRDQPAEAEQAERIRQMVEEAMSHAQELARGLVPVQMGGPVLCLALEELARTTSRLRGIFVSFQQTGDPQAETVEDGVHLYRIAQEAVNNSARHGGAKRVSIILSRNNGVLRLTVVDDGKGMTSLPVGASGLGLPSMKYRAQALGGELRIESTSPRGTIVSCEIPNYPHRSATSAS